jgi:hypothetical protein
MHWCSGEYPREEQSVAEIALRSLRDHAGAS